MPNVRSFGVANVSAFGIAKVRISERKTKTCFEFFPKSKIGMQVRCNPASLRSRPSTCVCVCGHARSAHAYRNHLHFVKYLSLYAFPRACKERQGAAHLHPIFMCYVLRFPPLPLQISSRGRRKKVPREIKRPRDFFSTPSGGNNKLDNRFPQYDFTMS